MPRLKYNGPLSRVQVIGFGHMCPGDVRTVDSLTAVAFQDPRCAAEGWEVLPDPVAEAPVKPAPTKLHLETPQVEDHKE